MSAINTIVSPGDINVSIRIKHCRWISLPGKCGVISRSGTLTYEVAAQLTAEGIGQSTCMGIGGDPIIGTTHRDALELFNKDPGTDIAVLIGEIGGTDEETAARYIDEEMTKPVVAFIAGSTAPRGKRPRFQRRRGFTSAGGRDADPQVLESRSGADLRPWSRPCATPRRPRSGASRPPRP